jgi:1,2-dihydroxy-3-keto-5-methylthiopentene dioxygenase
VERLPGRLKKSYALSPEDQQTILDLYEPELSDLKTRQGYLAQDIVVLSDKTPDLGALLRKFRREHHHTDDEVRFVLDGSGVFTIRRNGSIFDVTLQAGDLLVVPAYTRHSFELTEDRRIKCIRVFKDPAGWAAVYDEPQRPSLLNYTGKV